VVCYGGPSNGTIRWGIFQKRATSPNFENREWGFPHNSDLPQSIDLAGACIERILTTLPPRHLPPGDGKSLRACHSPGRLPRDISAEITGGHIFIAGMYLSAMHLSSLAGMHIPRARISHGSVSHRRAFHRRVSNSVCNSRTYML